MKSSLRLPATLSVLAAAFVFSTAAHAQLKTPAASPHSVLKQTVGLTEIEVDYSRPGAKGRAVFGGLVPYGTVWRTGANQPTKITFSDAVEIAGETLPAGEYALYTIPEKGEWTVIIYGNTELWGAFGYDEANDVMRFKAKSQPLSHHVESFTIGIDELRNDGATFYLDWEKTRVSFPFEVPTSKKVMSQIEEMKGTPAFENPNVLFAAGTFYHESGEDLEQALEWVSEACKTREQPAYWMYARKASIELDLGMKKEAKESAEKTLKLATEGGNPDYQKIAQDILAQL